MIEKVVLQQWVDMVEKVVLQKEIEMVGMWGGKRLGLRFRGKGWRRLRWWKGTRGLGGSNVARTHPLSHLIVITNYLVICCASIPNLKLTPLYPNGCAW